MTAKTNTAYFIELFDDLIDLLNESKFNDLANELKLKKKHSYPIVQTYNRSVNLLVNKLIVNNVLTPIRELSSTKSKIWISIPDISEKHDSSFLKKSTDPSITAMYIIDSLNEYLKKLVCNKKYKCLMIESTFSICCFEDVRNKELIYDEFGDWSGWDTEIIQAYIHSDDIDMTHKFIEIKITR